jgi:hypothetical protein
LTRAFVTAWALSLASASSQAATLIEHTGADDPVTEGWTVSGAGVGVVVGPVIDDGGSGIDAWGINDTTTAAGSTRLYSFVPTVDDLASAANGWTLRVRLRVVETPEDPDRATAVDFISDTTRYRMDFGSDPSGDPIVLLQTGLAGGNDTGPSVTLTGGGDGYHTYELRFDPVGASADLWIDGVELFSNYTGFADVTAGPRIAFGAGQATRTGNANFNQVRFTVAPACDADIDGDGDTDVFDFAELASNFGAGPGATREQGDLTGDGFVDVFDFADLTADFGCAP